MQDYEKLGAFYLGREYDVAQSAVKDDLLLYEANDLTTHGICVGMTGSGKTGLCISLLEEAAIDGIPAIAIDPKGDLGNLMLTFPQLQPSDFRPWIDESEAARKGLTPAAYAQRTAKVWKDGLAQWAQDGSRIERFRRAADIAIYTPGSNAGLPITVLRSFDAPSEELILDSDAMRERVQSATSGLLALLGLNADPIRSREHILVSSILDHAWRAGRDLNLGDLIRQIQSPPFDKVGVFDLESFFGSNDRFELAMRINNLLASPGFTAWLEGEPLNIGNLLYTSDGKPRIAILSIAHLSDSERMFFVTILLNELLAWVRTQSGTSSLRALLYMDEIYGYFPPSAAPPSKKPMLTMLKQARAFGIGVILATQNPVDLDYKGLANTGTWFIGRLQTERDKMRVLDGLEGASASAGSTFNRAAMEKILAGLSSRVFLMHNVHEDAPVIFHTRWALSYLRGPLDRKQIQGLMLGTKSTPHRARPKTTSTPLAVESKKAATSGEELLTERPQIPSSIPEYFISTNQAVGSSRRLLYRPAIIGMGRLHYVKANAKIDEWKDVFLLAKIPKKIPQVNWDKADVCAFGSFELESAPQSDATYGDLPGLATHAKNFTAWKKTFKESVYQNCFIEVFHCKELRHVSRPEESEGEFLGRIKHLAKEKRDLSMGKLRETYDRKLATVEDRIRRAESKVDRERSQHGHQKLQAAISIGATLVGALFGRKLSSARNVGRATTAVRGINRTSREKEDIGRAEDELTLCQEKLVKLEQDFEQKLVDMRASFEPASLSLEPAVIRPRKSDIVVSAIGLAWTPWEIDADGVVEPLFGKEQFVDRIKARS